MQENDSKVLEDMEQPSRLVRPDALRAGAPKVRRLPDIFLLNRIG